jgi:hypothetical protein
VEGSQFVECVGPARDLQQESVNGGKIQRCSIAFSVCCWPFWTVCRTTRRNWCRWRLHDDMGKRDVGRNTRNAGPTTRIGKGISEVARTRKSYTGTK